MNTNYQTKSDVQVQVEFGNPTIKCSRFGICQIGLAKRKDKKCLGLQSATGKLKLVGDVLGLEFLMSDLSDYVLSTYFDGNFIIEVDTPIPDLILKEIGLKEIIIAKGRYKLEINEGVVWMKF